MDAEAAVFTAVTVHPHDNATSSDAPPLPSIELNSGSLHPTGQATSPGSSSSKPNLTHSSLSSRQPSPALSGITTLTSISATPPPPLAAGVERTGPPPAKRRKLTETEKIQKRVEKAEKEQQKAIEKVRKDEEKLRKDEERRLKNEEREDKKRQQELIRQQKEQEKQKKNEEKEDRKREKEEEERRKQEEKDKKERAQSRINAFFAKPSTPAKSKSGPSNISMDATKSPVPLDLSGCHDTMTDANKVESVVSTSDYEREFPPLPAAPGTTWAPYNRFSWDEDAQQFAEKRVAECLTLKTMSKEPSVSLKHTFDIFKSSSSHRSASLPSVRKLIASLQGSALNPIDLTHHAAEKPREEQALQKIPLKYIFFSVDVRPPYIGTNTNLRSIEAASRLGRNPFVRSYEDLDYEYDSEAEWEEPEEGEDLGSENESVADSADEDDLDGFLDDEDDAQLQKARVSAGAPIEPITTGLYWESATKISRHGDTNAGLRAFRMEIVKETLNFPVDPFSTSYWDENLHAGTGNKTGNQMGAGQVHRSPLQVLSKSSSNSGAPADALSTLGQTKSTRGPKKATGILSGSELEAFKHAVRGSDLPKAGLLAILKKQFPKTTNDVLKDTLGAVAARVGAKAVDKKWEIVENGNNV